MNQNQVIDVVAGLATAIKVLLGDKVASEMEKTLGHDLTIKFLKLHTVYDHLSEKYPDSDPVLAALDSTAPSFDSFDEYVKFLQKMEQKTSSMKVEPSPEFHKILVQMLQVVAKAPKVAHAGVELPNKMTTPHFADTARLGITLPPLPLSGKAREALPYSYPSYTATSKIVKQTWKEKNYEARATDELNQLLKRALGNLATMLRHTEHLDVCPCDLVIAAQEYLLSHNWLRYGLENVAEASMYLAIAGYEHTVTCDGDILLSPNCNVHYEFIGAGLERILRRVIFNLERDVMSGTMLAGRQPAVDVVVACCSELVQDSAKQWLKTIRETIV